MYQVQCNNPSKLQNLCKQKILVSLNIYFHSNSYLASDIVEGIEAIEVLPIPQILKTDIKKIYVCDLLIQIFDYNDFKKFIAYQNNKFNLSLLLIPLSGIDDGIKQILNKNMLEQYNNKRDLADIIYTFDTNLYSYNELSILT